MSDIKSIIAQIQDISILYVEDDKGLQESFGKLLSNLSNRVFISENGIEALNIFKKKRIDIIITDVNMPIMNGLELTKEIKDINKNQHIVLCSSADDKEVLHKAIELGVDDFILKPFNTDIINKLIKIMQKCKLSNTAFDMKLKSINAQNQTSLLIQREQLLQKIDTNILQSKINIIYSRLKNIYKENSYLLTDKTLLDTYINTITIYDSILRYKEIEKFVRNILSIDIRFDILALFEPFKAMFLHQILSTTNIKREHLLEFIAIEFRLVDISILEEKEYIYKKIRDIK